MPRKIKQWWVYTTNENLLRELNRLLIEEQDFNREQESPDGVLPMWRIRDVGIRDQFLTAARAGPYKFQMYEEGQFGQIWRTDKSETKSSNLKLAG